MISVFESVFSIDALFTKQAKLMDGYGVYGYLTKYMTESNVAQINDIIKNIKNVPQEYYNYSDAAIYLLCNEAINLDELTEFIKDLCGVNGMTEQKLAADRILMLLAAELGYIKFSNNISINRRKLVIDHIPKVYYGNKYKQSYKDLQNIADETRDILIENNFTNIDVFCNILGINEYSGKEGNLLMSVNNNSPLIENHIPALSLILNNINIKNKITEVNESNVMILNFSDRSILTNICNLEVITKDENGEDIKTYPNIEYLNKKYYIPDILVPEETGEKDTIEINIIKSNIKSLLENIMQRTINYNLT